MKSILGAIMGPIADVVGEFVEDKDQANQIIAGIQTKVLSLEETIIKSAASIITAEAGGASWLQRNWRPMTMLWFAGLVGAHWLGFTPENLTEAQVIGLLDIVKLGLGGYVIGRSAEKIASSVAPNLGGDR